MECKKNPKGAGRKPKAKEVELIEALTPYDEIARQKLIEGVKKGDFNFVKLFYEYRFGKPKQQINVINDQELPKQIFKIGDTEIEL